MTIDITSLDITCGPYRRIGYVVILTEQGPEQIEEPLHLMHHEIWAGGSVETDYQAVVKACRAVQATGAFVFCCKRHLQQFEKSVLEGKPLERFTSKCGRRYGKAKQERWKVVVLRPQPVDAKATA